MTNPTNPFNWQMPTASDLVTDLPADFETFGQAVATSMADLLGGTTGQVLSKASNTDMDFTWVAQDDSNAIQNAIVDAKGDLIAASAADTPARLAVGADYGFLSALASESTGLKWSSDWTTWTPTINGATVGNGTVTAKYQRIGKTLIGRFDFILGSTSSITGDFNFTLPFSVANASRVIGNGMMYNGAVGVIPAVAEQSGNALYLRSSVANTNYVIGQTTGSTQPGTWSTSNWLAAFLVYEVA